MKILIQRLTASRLVSLGVKLALTLLAFIFVFANIDGAQLYRIWREQDHLLIAAAGAMIVLQLLLGALRWWVLALALSDNNPRAFSYGRSFVYYHISSFFNCCLPGTVGGDVLRVWLARSEHFPLTASIYSVLLDRILSLMALVVLVAITLPAFSAIAGFAPWPVVAITLLLALLAMAVVRYFDVWFVRFSTLRLYHAALYIINGMRMMLRHKRASFLSLAYGVLSHLTYCLCGLFLAHSLAIDMTWMQAIILLPLVLLVTVLPISIGGWGVREAGAIGLLGLIGVAKAEALMLSIQLGLVNIFISLPGGLMWLALRRRRENIDARPV